jgi:hypothetical protein
MNTIDKTPTPVAVEVEPIPKATDSSKQFAIEVAQSERIRGSRSLVKALAFSGVVGAAIVGPHAVDSMNESHQRDVAAGIEKTKEVQSPMPLNAAHTSALKAFFSYGEDKKGYDFEAASKIMEEAKRSAEKGDWQLPVDQFVNPEQVKISEDGRSFELQGQAHSIARYRSRDGHMYVLSARSYEEDNLIRDDKTHMVSPMIIGGARPEDGLTREDLIERADTDARQRLEEALKTWKSAENLAIETRSDGEKIILSQK